MLACHNAPRRACFWTHVHHFSSRLPQHRTRLDAPHHAPGCVMDAPRVEFPVESVGLYSHSGLLDTSTRCMWSFPCAWASWIQPNFRIGQSRPQEGCFLLHAPRPCQGLRVQCLTKLHASCLHIVLAFLDHRRKEDSKRGFRFSRS